MNDARGDAGAHEACAGPPHEDGLTALQQQAIDLLVGGRTDSQTAFLLGVHRVTVTRWRRYSPAFRTALAACRASVWAAAADTMRSLIPKALKALAEELDVVNRPSQRMTVALAVLKLAAALPLAPPDPGGADDDARPAGDGDRVPSDGEVAPADGDAVSR